MTGVLKSKDSVGIKLNKEGRENCKQMEHQRRWSLGISERMVGEGERTQPGTWELEATLAGPCGPT